MNATSQRFANRCLPLLIANQAGWCILNDVPVRMSWNGSTALDAVSITYEGPPPGCRAVTHFGEGIVTWNIPYLFRTPPGWNLLVRGPANWPKDSICALEGIVETDWTPATFTMNWKFTRPNTEVRFERGEPIGMIVPQRRGELEEFQPVIASLASDPATRMDYQAWTRDRTRFLTGLAAGSSDVEREGWQRHYFQGRLPDNTRVPEHQTKLKLQHFKEESNGIT